MKFSTMYSKVNDEVRDIIPLQMMLYKVSAVQQTAIKRQVLIVQRIETKREYSYCLNNRDERNWYGS